MAAALITGSARGIGAAIALRLAKDGFDVALNDISEKSFENNDIMEQIKAQGVKCEKFIADVSKSDQVEAMVKAVKELFGSIDVLVNNAGITRDGLLARMSEENYDLVIAVNQKSVYNMMRYVAPIMMKQRSGRIINMSSVAGLHGNAGQFNYSASKAAIIGMTKSAAKELGSRGINVNAIAPGFISTPMTDQLSEEQKKAILELIAMKRYGNVEEIAGVASFLAGKDSSYVTGQVIEISGGLSM
ncbi:MAG TPA: 3-oxoacyl-[acyl-carrier-protein] reductase [Ruminococcaceae bacterium]|nr:3-oxoacyl-[acyl-carrier-protein] reductase [Oscillospiraceae bacterium]